MFRLHLFDEIVKSAGHAFNKQLGRHLVHRVDHVHFFVALSQPNDDKAGHADGMQEFIALLLYLVHVHGDLGRRCSKYSAQPVLLSQKVSYCARPASWARLRPMSFRLQLAEAGPQNQHIIVSADDVFFTTQGEGPTMGSPAVFLRTNQCNLDCGFCDTRYTWDKKHELYPKRKVWSVAHARQQILAATRDGCTRLVLTGGEPLLQQEALALLAGEGGLQDWYFEIETNGTRVPESFREREKVQINCSPKLANSGVEKKRRIRPDVLQELAAGFHTYFKFVVTGPKDLQEIDDDYGPHLAGLPPGRVYVSPEGRTVARLDEVLESVRKGVAERAWVLGDRDHIRRYGDMRRT